MKLKFVIPFLALVSVAALPVFAADVSGIKMLDGYAAVSAALAADDLDAAKQAAADLAATAGADHPEMANKARAVAECDSVETARKKFKLLSEDAVKLAEGRKGYFVMTCPMAGGDWVQKNKQVANPYYGASMLRCGGLKKN